MSCAAVSSGSQFLTMTLAHIDCQAERMGSYGYGALANPGSVISVTLTGLLTMFVAIWGFRLMLGYPVHARDAVGTVIRAGIVLTLATSWPAWRVVGYDVIMNGPTEIARAVAIGADVPGSENDLTQQLQKVDDGLVALTALGTGRLPGSDLRDIFRGVALQDETGFSWGRLLFLFGAIAPYAIVRLGAGILLSLAPLFVAFFLFRGTSGLFQGWIRGLAFSAIGSLVLSLILGVNLAILEPWIADAIARRTAGEFAPSAAIEMAALSLVFVAITIGALFLIARVTFLPYFSALLTGSDNSRRETTTRAVWAVPETFNRSPDPPDRAHDIASSVAKSIWREETEALAITAAGPGRVAARNGPDTARTSTHPLSGEETLGSSYRRNFRRPTASSEQRDRRT